nr:predicted GPI-anchored protein 58 [Peromyscus maniculatus bairdii]
MAGYKSLVPQFPRGPISNFFKTTASAGGDRGGHVLGATVNSPARTLRVPDGGVDTHSAPWGRSRPDSAVQMQVEQKLVRDTPHPPGSPQLRPARPSALLPAGPEPRRVRPTQPSYPPAAGAPHRCSRCSCASGSARCPRCSSHPEPSGRGAPAASFHKSPGAQPAPAFQTGPAPAAAVPGRQASPQPPPPPQLSETGGESPRKKRGGGCHSRLPPGNRPPLHWGSLPALVAHKNSVPLTSFSLSTAGMGRHCGNSGCGAPP